MLIQTPTVFLAVDGDGIGRQVGRAVLSDQPDEVRRISQAIDQGEQLWKAFVERSGGSIVSYGGDEISFEIPASALGEVAAIRNQYSNLVGATVSVGIGRKLSEASKALLVAKARGKDRTLFYSPEIEREFAKLQTPSEQDKIRDEYLNKGELPAQNPGPNAGFEGHHSAPVPPPTNSAAPIPPPPVQHPVAHYEKQFRAAAEKQEAADQQAQQQQGEDVEALRQGIAQALQKIHSQMPAFVELKETNPQAYEGVIALTQGVIEIARQLQMQKAEGQPGTYWAGVECMYDNAEECPDIDCTHQLDKTVIEGANPTHHLTKKPLPVGTTHNGKMKVQHAEGAGWVGVKDGMIPSEEREAPIGGQNSHPVSSRRPDTK